MCAVRLLYGGLSPVCAEGILIMQMISLKNSTGKIPHGAVWVLGFFDGVHAGHRLLLEKAALTAGKTGDSPLPVAVWSFASLPKADILLTTREESAALLGEYGADWLVLADFDAVSYLDGETFFRSHLLEAFAPAAIVCGFNFRFGCGGRWTAADLAEMGRAAGVPVEIADAFTDGDGVPVSSTRIRTLIQDGEMEKATSLLGRPYSITAPVEHGKKLGRTIGFPTINQRMPEKKAVPAHGIYLCCASFTDGDGTVYDLPGVCNIGFRPTVNSDRSDITLETFILGYHGDLYGRDVRISLYKKQRDEQKFPDVDVLSRQIADDAAAAEAYFAAAEGGRICF
ncbi:MAG: riboflavin biosynthesis protein RibF [Ruminococcaceae bacterium]|nr:riboflavin biosynthesis protein RibF [Oscillospiraceae bacterium]